LFLVTPLPHDKLMEAARQRVIDLRGDPRNSKHVLGQLILQFGQYQGQNFLWLMENVLGWVARLAISVEEELQQDVQEPATVTDQVRNKRHLLVSIAMFHLSPFIFQ
jgi:hypothetical protein